MTTVKFFRKPNGNITALVTSDHPGNVDMEFIQYVVNSYGYLVPPNEWIDNQKLANLITQTFTNYRCHATATELRNI